MMPYHAVLVTGEDDLSRCLSIGWSLLREAGYAGRKEYILAWDASLGKPDLSVLTPDN